EIGEVKSQIVFSGETLVELQKLKKARAVFESNLIISESLIQWNVIPSIYSKKELGSISLNDHEQSLKVYAGSESNLEKIIVFDDRISLTHDGSIHFSEFLAYGNSIPDSVLDQKIRKIKNGDLATLIYTSGTTGVPKGVMLTHGNFNEAFRIHDLRLKVQEDDLSLAFLPLSHIFERAWSLYALHKGVKVTFLSNPKLISQTLREIQPTVMCSVPRLYQKAYHAIQAKINQASSIRKKLFKAALETGKSYNEHIRNGEKPSFLLSVKYKFFDTLIFRKIKSAFGGKLRLMPCAGAPLSGQITEFFHIIGMPVLIGYGLTETCATVSVFPETGYKFGTVGTLMPDIEVKIGPENEILVKGGTVMKGYYKKPEETGKVFENGWFKTGDSGSVDAEGHMTITGRIKDLMKTSNGKYVAPQPLEALLTNDNYIENVVLVGDDKPYVTALLVPNFDALKDLAQSLNVKYHDLEDLIKTSSIIEFYEEKLDQLQKSLAGFEKIKKFTLLSQDFNMQQGELTPTLKVRRTVVLDRFSDIIDRMYSFQ
ncbi:MAG: AMP-binding protein, partial [Cyclobacteriaceae bacterium]|nr:AMP-binding protein [Cyclobacteriaceae bacterium]